MFRPAFPKVPGAENAKAPVLNHRSGVGFESSGLPINIRTVVIAETENRSAGAAVVDLRQQRDGERTARLQCDDAVPFPSHLKPSKPSHRHSKTAVSCQTATRTYNSPTNDDERQSSNGHALPQH